MIISPVSVERLADNLELLQAPLWARFKERYGWQVHPFLVETSGAGFATLILSQKTPAGRIAYCPYGPLAGGRSADDAAVATLAMAPSQLIECAQRMRDDLPSDTIHLRFDLPAVRWPHDSEATLGAAGRLVRAGVDVQPRATVIIDLDEPASALLPAAHKKTRYNIRLARRRGVDVRPVDVDHERAGLREWYGIHQETGRRNRIAVHSADYFRTLFETSAGVVASEPTTRLELLMAFVDEEPVAGIIVSQRGTAARYLYGASSDRHRELMPNYLLQWTAIERALAAGCETYDLFGIPPDPGPNHPMAGLYRFKTGFGGRIVHRLGGYDVPFRPIRYRMWRTAESARNLYHKRLKRLIGR